MPYIAEKAQVTYGEELYGSYATPATTRTRSFGLVGKVDVPGPEWDLKEIRAIGAGRDLHQIAVGKQINEGIGMPLVVQDWRWLLYFLGAVADIGTDKSGGGGSTISLAAAIGDTSVTMTDPANYATGDYMQIGTGANAEIRQITVSGSVFTLDEQLRKAHAALSTCNEVEAPFTHTITGGDLMVAGFNLPSATIDIGYPTVGAEDFGLEFLGCMGESCEISCEAEDVVKANMTWVAALVAKITSLEQLTIESTTPYLFSMGDLEWNVTPVARVNSFKLNLTNNGKVKNYIRSTDGQYGYEYIPGKRALAFSAEITPDDATILDDVLAAEERGIEILFTRGTGDTVTLAGTVTPKSMKMNVPESGEIPATIEGTLKTLTVTVVDSIDHY